jgi:hypothetical protein
MIAKKNKYDFFLLSLLAIFILNNRFLYSQYSQAEINRAVTYLSEKGLLSNLVALTEQDRTKLTSRPDVLMACYDILASIDQVEDRLISRTDAIDQSVTQIRSRLSQQTPENVDYNALVRRVLSEVDKRLAGMSSTGPGSAESINALQTRNARLEKELNSLRDALNNVNPDVQTTSYLKKRTDQNRIIAISGIVISAVVAVLAAR